MRHTLIRLDYAKLQKCGTVTLLFSCIALAGCVTASRQSLPESQRDLSGNFDGTYSLKQLAAETQQTTGSHEFDCPDLQEERSYMMFVREGQAIVQGGDAEERAFYVSLLGNFYAEYPMQAAFGSFTSLSENDNTTDEDDSKRNGGESVVTRETPSYNMILQGKLSKPYRGGITWGVEELKNTGCTAPLKIERL